MTNDEFQDLGEPYRQALGIDGTAGDAMDIPHPYTPHERVGCCVVCGMAESFRAHHQERR
jgi:hypothetical protein